VDEITIMPKELRDAPVTEMTIPCPCCQEKLVFSVRVGAKELVVGCVSEKQRAVQSAILQAVERSSL
jgi:hypothetical protein